jgi:hypothetical protein
MPPSQFHQDSQSVPYASVCLCYFCVLAKLLVTQTPSPVSTVYGVQQLVTNTLTPTNNPSHQTCCLCCIVSFLPGCCCCCVGCIGCGLPAVRRVCWVKCCRSCRGWWRGCHQHSSSHLSAYKGCRCVCPSCCLHQCHSDHVSCSMPLTAYHSTAYHSTACGTFAHAAGASQCIGSSTTHFVAVLEFVDQISASKEGRRPNPLPVLGAVTGRLA